jgi:hypothetical protein
MPVLAFGVIYSIPVAIFGAVVILFGAYGWAIEPSTAPDDDIDPPSESGTSMGVAHVS